MERAEELALSQPQESGRPGDLPPVFRANLILVESVSQEDGHEEAIHRRADHRLPEAGGRR
ncbi:hypothetical protein, partial [Stenotrophomonas muris]|uniref:hypothetical protein n=1 Tax=Stenotrophomonas muris TaxID=2963283 RepID=UPI00300E9FE7